MREIKLSPRLLAIAKLIEGDVFADIGTDHALLPVYLLQNNKIKTAIASDVNKGPLKAADKTAKTYGATLDLRLGSGISTLKHNECHCICIAGMGGELICSILEDFKATNNPTLILQPMSAIEDVRKFLFENGYKIISETIVEDDNKLYVIIKTSKGSDEINEYGYFLSRKSFENPLFLDYINHLIYKADIAVNGASKGKNKEILTALIYKKEMLLKGKNDYENR